jgi:hypothetical protein
VGNVFGGNTTCFVVGMKIATPWRQQMTLRGNPGRKPLDQFGQMTSDAAVRQLQPDDFVLGDAHTAQRLSLFAPA